MIPFRRQEMMLLMIILSFSPKYVAVAMILQLALLVSINLPNYQRMLTSFYASYQSHLPHFWSEPFHQYLVEMQLPERYLLIISEYLISSTFFLISNVEVPSKNICVYHLSLLFIELDIIEISVLDLDIRCSYTH